MQFVDWTLAAVVAAASLLTSCMREDEELQRQLIEARAALDAKSKSVEQLQAQLAGVQSQRGGEPGGSSGELAKAKATIADLTKQVDSLKSQAASSAQGSATTAPMQLDLDVMAGKLEEDLTRKAKQLRELVQKQSPSSRIDEISLKSIQYPPQLVTPFSSAITFNLAVEGGRTLRLMFPVTADLSGSWKLPAPDEVQKAYKAAQEQPQGVASAGGGAAPVQQQGGGPSASPSTGGRGSSMRQVDANTFVFDWGDAPTGQQPRQQQPRQPQPFAPQPAAPPSFGGSQTLNNFTPPGQTPPGQAAPQQPSAPPAPSAPQTPNVPPPIMPVVGDRIIRFND